MYDLMIIGGGSAGLAASVYATRKRLKTLLVMGELAAIQVAHKLKIC